MSQPNFKLRGARAADNVGCVPPQPTFYISSSIAVAQGFSPVQLAARMCPCWPARSGGIANPLEVIEQITYLLFLRRLDDLHTLQENRGKNPKKRRYEDLRWSKFTNCQPKEMFTVVSEHAFP